MTNQSSLNLNLPQTPIDSVEGYQFEPIKGYPMLNWKGKRPFTNTVYYPAQLKERHGEAVNGWLSKIFWGDNLQVMSHLLKEFRGKINLVYIDPPFDSKADYKKKISLRNQQVSNDQNAFEEKQYTDIWTNDEYLQFMYERLILIRELLADNGSIYLHCDSSKSSYIKLILDEIFDQRQQQTLTLNLETDNNSTDKPTNYYTGFEVYNVNHYDIFRNPLEAKELLLEALEVQKLPDSNLFHGEKDGRMVYIMPVNRIATKKDLNEIIAGLDYKALEKRQEENPNKPVEKITLVCMGHEPDLGAKLKAEVLPYKLDVEVVDILRDRNDLQFKRDSEAKIEIKSPPNPPSKGGSSDVLVIEKFYPLNLLSKLSLEQEKVEDWRELVESIMIDFNYDGAIFEPTLVDIPDKKELVKGSYKIPPDAGTIKIKITDLLSESLEIEVQYG